MPVIKVSDEEYNKIQIARRKLIMNGIRTLPPKIRKETIDIEKFTFGAIVGVGIALLLKELAD
jgi:hypothetical protein